MKAVQRLNAKLERGIRSLIGTPNSTSKLAITDILPAEIMQKIVEEVRTQTLSPSST